MSELTARTFRRPSPTTVVAAVLVTAGILLTGVSWWFVLVAGLGAFGPGVLRELGVLHDKDEFQRQADHRAGYHAFLATGFVALVQLAFVRTSEPSAAAVGDLPMLLVSVLGFTWLFSALASYWGGVTAASRVLRVFGTLWLVFAIVSNVGSEWTGWTALLLHPLLAAPFFVLAWTAARRPRTTGALLVAASLFFFEFFDMFQNDNLSLMTQGVTFVLFVGPLLASGVALVGHCPDDDDPGDDDPGDDDLGDERPGVD